MSERTVSVKITGNASDFQAALEAAGLQAKVVADQITGAFGTTFKAKLDAAFKSLPDIKLNADSSDTDRKISFIRGELESLSKKTVGIDISDTEAKVKLDDLKLKLLELGAKSTSLQVKVDTSSAVTEINKLGAAATSAIAGAGSGGSGGLSGLTSSLSGIGSSGPYAAIGIGLLATTLIPIAGIATAGAIGLTGMAVAAGAAAGAFGLAVLPVFTQVSTAITQIDADQKAISRSTSLSSYATNVQKLNLDLKNLNPTVATLVQGVLNVKQAFLTWDAQFNPDIIGVFNAVLADVKPLLNDITPLVHAGASALTSMAQQIGLVANQPDFKNFISFLAAQAGPAFGTIASVIEQFGQAFADILQKSGPLIKDVEKGLTSTAAAALKWVDGGGFQKFLNWVQANGPTIVKDVKDIAKSLTEIIVALAPVGLVVLNILDAFTHLGGALSVSNGVVKGIVGTFIVLGGALTLVLAPLIWLGSQWDSIWNGIRTATEVTWHAIHNDVFAPLVNFFTETIPHALSVVSGAFTSVFQAIKPVLNAFKATWDQVWHAISDVVKVNWDIIKGIFAVIGGILVASLGVAVLAFKAIWNAVWPTVSGAVIAAWHAIDSGFVQPVVAFFTAIPGQVNHVWSDIVNAIHAAWSAVANWVSANVIQPVVAFFNTVAGAVNHVWSDVVNAIHSVWSTIASWVSSNVIQPVVNFYNQIAGFINHVWSDVVNDIHGAWSAIANWVNANIIQPVISFFSSITSGTSHVWGEVVGAIQSAWSGISGWVMRNVVDPITGAFASLESDVIGVISRVISAYNSIPVLPDVRNISNPFTGPGQSGPAGPAGSMAHALGGVFTTPQFGEFAEDGAEAILPLTNPSRAAQIMQQIASMFPNALGMTAGQSGGGGSFGGSSSGSSGPVQVNLYLPDGTRFAEALLPDLLTAAYQYKRGVGTLQLS